MWTSLLSIKTQERIETMTTKEMYKMFKDYRELYDRAVRERAYGIALELKRAYKNSDWKELKRLVNYYNQ